MDLSRPAASRIGSGIPELPARSIPRHALTLGAALLVLGSTLVSTEAVGALAPAGPPPRSYVALGDSYTSGPALSPQLGPDTDPSAPSACKRSADNYPSLVARDLDVTLTDVSCAGATTTDLTKAQGTDIPAQFAALGPTTSLVSLGVGGNDLGYSAVIADCASLTPWGATKYGWHCRAHFDVDGVDQLVSRVREVGAKVAAALRSIGDRAPNARVFVIGYPDLLPPTGPGCWPRLPFSANDLAYLRSVQNDLNGTLAGDAAAAGDTFVDMGTPSATHSACTSHDTRWVEPIVPSPGSYPLHPSASGMAGMARVLEGAITAT